MALPTSRDYDATDTGPLTHTTVNNIQDCIVNGSHGSISSYIQARDFYAPSLSMTSGTHSLGLAGGSAEASVNLPAGSIITEIEFRYYTANSSSDVAVELRERDADDMTSTVLDSDSATGSTGNLDLTLSGTFTLQSDQIYSIKIAETVTTEVLFYRAKLTYYKP